MVEKASEKGINLPTSTKWRCALAVVYAIMAAQVYDIYQHGNFLDYHSYGNFLDTTVWKGQTSFLTIGALKRHVPELLSQLVLAIVFTFGHIVTRRLFYPISDRLIKYKPAWTEEIRAARRDRWCASIFKLLYFISVSIWGWNLLIQQDWFPPALGGKGDLRNMLPSATREGYGDSLWFYPTPVPTDANLYYRVASAYHLSELIFQILIEWNRPDFYDMFLHHLCTCWLLVFSLVAGMERHGTVILFIHDVSDIPVYLCKFTVDVQGLHDAIVLTPYVGMLVSWGYLRLWFLPQVIYRCYADPLMLGLRGTDIFVLMLSCLVFLHCFWYFKFVQMGLRFLRGGGCEDGVANLEKLEKYAYLFLSFLT